MKKYETEPVHNNLIDTATQNISDILSLALMHTSKEAALVVYDKRSPLAILLLDAYHRCLPDATFIDFDSTSQTDILSVFDTLKPSDLVVFIQSTSFRLGPFRIRIELFEKSLKVIEHPHLSRMTHEQLIYYVDSLAYDSAYYRGTGYALKKLIDSASRAVVDSGGELLTFSCPLEPAKLNVGDYTGMKNIGGQFPIGEVFTEAQDLEAVNGRVRIFIFGDTTFQVNQPDNPITLIINKGRVTDVLHSTLEFDAVLTNIQADEGEIWLRELGFGMNRAFTKDRRVCDIGTYERMCGIHLSLGAKHSVYKKPQIKRNDAWHHVDVFAATELVYLDEMIVYKNGKWQV
jgi:aminopeptidase